MPCYGPCCTQCHSRMGTGECGPRHVFDTTSSNNGRLSGACVIVDQLLGRPLLHLGCRQVAEWYGAGLCDREVSGWTPACVCCVPMPTQRAILPPGSVNEYQRKLGSKQAYYRQFAVVLQLRLVSGWGLQETEMLVLAAAFGVRMGPSKAPGNPHVRAVAWTVGINWSGWLPSDYGDFFWWLCFFTANRDQRLDWLIDWVIRVYCLHQHGVGYLGDSFTGQKTQPTVSKYRRKKRCKSKENPEKANNTKYSNTIKRYIPKKHTGNSKSPALH